VELPQRAQPAIAIVGSTDPRRTYDPPVRDADRGEAAGEALGRELASQGCRIIVYSGAESFIEASVVRGYVASGSASPGSIQVRFPQGSVGGRFAELDQRPELFDLRPDASPDWEVSYYRSLVATDGVLLLGGGRSTYITGLIALAFGIPIVAVAGFGGFTERVWRALDRTRNDAEDDDVAAMGQPWHEGLATTLVKSLRAQVARRAARRAKERRDARRDARHAAVSLVVAAVVLVLAVGTIPLAHSWEPGTGRSLAVLIAAPLLAAIAGAIIRHTFDEGHEWLRTAVLGMAAGAIASLLFVAAQLLTTPDVLESADARRLLFFVVPVGFIAGLTFDDVYRKLRAQDVARTDVLQR
jgi:hypothetical protein